MAPPKAAHDFDRLVRDHHGEVWRSARRVLRSDDDAQDVTQEVFLRVLDGRLDLDGESEPLRLLCWWSIQIALNTKRGARRRREHEDQHAMERQTTGEKSGDERQLWGFVERLPDDLRVPLVLRFAEGSGYAAIGDTLGVAESTAHLRVQRGLAKLRGLLKGAGLGALALDLETSIGNAAPAQAPSGLAQSLLEMKGATAATASGGLFALAAAGVLAAGAAAYALVGGSHAQDPGPALLEREVATVDHVAVPGIPDVAHDRRSVEPEVPVASTASALTAADEDQDEDQIVTGIVTGRIVSPEHVAVADCEVSIVSVERSGKLHTYSTRTATDVNGRFKGVVEVAAADEDGGYYRVQVVRDGRSALHSEARLVRAGVETDFGDLQMTPGEQTEQAVALERGLAIAGRVSLYGEVFRPEMAAGIKLHIVDALTGSWIFAEVEADGSFRFADLAAGTHRVHASNNDWRGVSLRLSSGWLDLAAGAEYVELVLKRSDDPRDVGVHGAELHGRFVRAEDGEPLEASFWSLDIDSVEVPSGADVPRDWLPNHLFSRPVQRAAMGALPANADRFHRTGLGGGTYLARVTMQNRAAFAYGPVRLGEREIVSDLVFELEPGATVKGSVYDTDGTELHGAYVFLTGVGPLSDAAIAEADREYHEAGGRGFFFVNGTGTRSKGGRFEIDRLPSDMTFRLVAVHPRFAPVVGATVTLRSGETRTVAPLRFAGPRRR